MSYLGKAPGAPGGVRTVYEFVATAGQTTFSGADRNGATLKYEPGFLDVNVGGADLSQVDYTAGDGVSVVLPASPVLPAGKIVRITAFGTYKSADALPLSGGNMQGIARPTYTNSQAVAAGASFTYNAQTHGQVANIAVSGAGTVTLAAPSNIVEGAMYKLVLKAADTQSRVYAWASAFKFPSGTAPLVAGTQNLGAYDVVSFLGGPSNTLIYQGHVSDVR